jgi:isoamylase
MPGSSTRPASRSSKFTLKVATEGATSVIVLSGHLRGELTNADRERVNALLEPGCQLVLDFSGVTGISGSGLRRLLQLTRYVRGVGGAVAARGVSEELHSIAQATGFMDLMERAAPQPIAEATQPRRQTDYYPTHHAEGYDLRPGLAMPLGATALPHGINFAVYSRNATGCSLVLYEPGARAPQATIPIPNAFRVGDVFAVTVFHLEADEFEYGFSMDGPFDPQAGHRFDRQRVLLDPEASAVVWRTNWRDAEPAVPSPRARLIAEDFDWEGDTCLQLPLDELIVYEMHVRGFTRHQSSSVRFPGTYAGLREKISYLVELGVNCVELMPIFEFDEMEVDRVNPVTGERLVNYWGYSTLGFCAPKAGYAASGPFGMEADEFKTLVKELHRHGIEVILDVVFNHTSEGNENGPTLSFKGLDNATYYMLTKDKQYYNFSGCGNTLNCNHPVVREFVLDCLRRWVAEYHIDGFRFDLASILGRAADGTPLANPPLLEALAQDSILGRTKLIAEAWDAGGLYQVGHFPAYGRWGEWNGKYRDCLRKFLKGDMGQVPELAQRLSGSPDLYYFRGPTASVNFVTCHDGFTLADTVSYDDKHNEANGEENRDGANDNYTWNCGAEGPTDDDEINQLRRRQMKNALAMLFVSQGVPMLLMGDEVGRSQQGNNNTYCQDNELSWLDWGLLAGNADLHRFTRALIALRKAHPALRHRHFAGVTLDGSEVLELTWHGTRAWQPDWSGTSRVLAFQARLLGRAPADTVYVAMNMYWDALPFEPPALDAGLAWHLAANTSEPSPNDICFPGEGRPVKDPASILVVGRSVVILTARPA